MNTQFQPLPKRSVAMAAFSTVVEWYDFTLYLYFASTIAKVYFGDTPKSLMITLAGFALSYLMRPLGAYVFGHFGDKFGRKKVLIFTMSLMTVAMLLTAILPTYTQIGAWSGILMLLLRCVMAFSVGGEYTGVVAYLVEGARPERRGLLSSLASGFSEVGGLLAVLMCALTVQFFGDELLNWGFRLPFLFGAMLALLVLILRHNLAESPEFAQQKSTEKSPILTVLTQHKKQVIHTFAISALGSITYYVGIVSVPVFLSDTVGLPENVAFWLSVVASFAIIVITPVMGYLSDRFGRKPVLIGACVASLILPIFLFDLMSKSFGLGLIGAVLLAFLAGTVSAVATSATSEQFDVSVRLSGLALGVTTSTAIFGGFTPFLSKWLTDWTGQTHISGLMIMLVALGVLPFLWQLKETAPRKIR